MINLYLVSYKNIQYMKIVSSQSLHKSKIMLIFLFCIHSLSFICLTSLFTNKFFPDSESTLTIMIIRYPHDVTSSVNMSAFYKHSRMRVGEVLSGRSDTKLELAICCICA